jgi:hypothetical protein
MTKHVCPKGRQCSRCARPSNWESWHAGYKVGYDRQISRFRQGHKAGTDAEGVLLDILQAGERGYLKGLRAALQMALAERRKCPRWGYSYVNTEELERSIHDWRATP